MKLLYAVDRGIGTITLSAPPRNELAHPAFADHAELAAFLAAPELRAVIVRGAGRHFCSGAAIGRLAELVKKPDEFRAALQQGKALLDLLTFAPVPVLALIRGACLGAGLEIALACHFRMASDHALLGLPESSLGLLPGFGGTVLAADVAGRKVALDLMLSGRIIGAPEALSLGLVDWIEPTAELEPRALGYVQSLVGDRPAAVVRAIMQAVHNARRLPRAQALEREADLFLELARARIARGDT